MPPVFDGESHPADIEAAIEAQMVGVDAKVSPFRLRNRYRSGVGTWIVSVAVPEGHVYDSGKLAEAADGLGMRIEGFFEYSGDLRTALGNDLGEPPTKDGLPLTNEDQSCAFCADEAPVWVHRLRPVRRGSFPSFWTVCERCESLIAGGRAAELARLFYENEADSYRQAKRAVRRFRAVDLGAQSMIHVPQPR